MTSAVHEGHGIRAPSDGEGEKATGEAESGEGHQGAADGQGWLAAGQVWSGGKDGEDESGDEQDDRGRPFDGVEVVRRVCEDPFDLVPVGNAFGFEEFVSLWRDVAGSEESGLSLKEVWCEHVHDVHDVHDYLGFRHVADDPVVWEESNDDEDGTHQRGDDEEQVAAGHFGLLGAICVDQKCIDDLRFAEGSLRRNCF